MLGFNLFLFFIFFSTLIYSSFSLIFNKESLPHRIEEYFSVGEKKEEEEDKKYKVKVSFRKIIRNLGNKIKEMGLLKTYVNNIQSELIRAGMPLKGEEFLSIQLLFISFFGILAVNIFKSPIIFLVIAIVGLLLPKRIIKIKKNKRNKLFNDQLGDSIVLISNSLKAGHSFLQSIDSVAREMPDPTAKEFKKMLREMTLGVPTEEALVNLLDRMESDDLELMVTAVLIQRQIGGNLSQILDNISNTIRERVKIKGEVRTLTAQGRMSGLIVSFLPFGLGVILNLINPGYMSELFKNPIGIAIIGAALINQFLGIYIISKIVKIEV